MPGEQLADPIPRAKPREPIDSVARQFPFIPGTIEHQVGLDRIFPSPGDKRLPAWLVRAAGWIRQQVLGMDVEPVALADKGDGLLFGVGAVQLVQRGEEHDDALPTRVLYVDIRNRCHEVESDLGFSWRIGSGEYRLLREGDVERGIGESEHSEGRADIFDLLLVVGVRQHVQTRSRNSVMSVEVSFS